MAFDLDEIGPWSEVKLDILRKYCVPYSSILRANNFRHGYIDAFSGPGLHVRKGDKKEVQGSPVVALNVEPPFSEYHFIDLDGEKIEHLKSQVGSRPGVEFYTGDSNRLLRETILPRFTFEQRTRALCLLDPYKLTLDWDVVTQAGQSRAVEVFINFPIMHMNRNCKKRALAEILPGELGAMDSFWGDRSWHNAMFRNTGQMDMFGGMDLEKNENDVLVSAYCSRLRDKAGFGFVAEPLPMRNSKGATVYFLIFAGPNATGWKIVQSIYNSYRQGT